MKRFIATILCAFLCASSTALALENTPTTSYDGSPVVQKITIRGIVPYMRVIYVNSKNHVVKVVGNTDKNITPLVITTAGANQIKMTPYINSQYQKILAANNGSLKAGETYYPAPDKLSLKPGLLKFGAVKLSAF